MSAGIQHPLFTWKEVSARAGGTHTSRHGQMCCSSMRFSLGFG